MDLDLNVIISNRDAITSSLTVAKAFHKRPDNVLQKIDDIRKNWKKLLDELPLKTRATNDVINPKTDAIQGELSSDIGLKRFKDCFFETEYLTENGRHVRSYNMNRDGFVLLTTGFNGKDALKFKLMFLDRFNEQERELAQRSAYYTMERRLRKRLTDTIQKCYTGDNLGGQILKFTNLLYITAAGNKADKLKRDRGLDQKVSAFADALTSVERDKYIDAENQLIIAYSTGTTDYYVLKDMLLEKKSA